MAIQETLGQGLVVATRQGAQGSIASTEFAEETGDFNKAEIAKCAKRTQPV